uniref:Uncharacterized protein n=1 Tax=Oryza glumipatula TaxID=40148 RepID=A0A0E0BMX1_9ORYZ
MAACSPMPEPTGGEAAARKRRHPPLRQIQREGRRQHGGALPSARSSRRGDGDPVTVRRGGPAAGDSVVTGRAINHITQDTKRETTAASRPALHHQKVTYCKHATIEAD